MLRLMKLSLFNVKNVIRSPKIKLAIGAAFLYSIFWIFIVPTFHPGIRPLEGYEFEFGRFLYLVILYASTLILQDDIRSNAAKAIFTGAFTRVQIMISKAISLVFLGIVFSIIVECNNLLTALRFYKEIGIGGFLNINHLQLFIVYIVVTFSMGWMVLLIVSITFNEKKTTLGYILFLGTANFYNSALITAIVRKPAILQKLPAYVKNYIRTPIYQASDLMYGNFYTNEVISLIIWGIVLFICSTFIINRREIR